MYDHHDDNHDVCDDDDDDNDDDDGYVHDSYVLQMREAEQRLTEEQETMLGLQVEPNKSSQFFLAIRISKAIFGGYVILVDIGLKHG